VSATLELVSKIALKWIEKRPFSAEAKQRRKDKRAAKRAARRGEVSTVEQPEDISMGKYSKAIGAVIGGLVMIVVIRFPFLAGVIPPGFADQAAVWLGALLGTYFSPANKT
jgi:hypothetical protein